MVKVWLLIKSIACLLEQIPCTLSLWQLGSSGIQRNSVIWCMHACLDYHIVELDSNADIKNIFIYIGKVCLYEGQHISRMPFTAEWWPAVSNGLFHIVLQKPTLSLAGIRMHRGGIRGGNNGVSPHGCGIKKERDALCGSIFQMHRCSGKQLKVGVCVFAYPLTSTVLFWTALDHWNVLRHQKNDTSKQRVFAKLWEMLSGDPVTFVLFRVLWKKGRAKTGVLLCQSPGDKGKALSQECTSPWLHVCHSRTESSHLCRFRIQYWSSGASPYYTEGCRVNIFLKIISNIKYFHYKVPIVSCILSWKSSKHWIHFSISNEEKVYYYVKRNIVPCQLHRSLNVANMYNP